MGISMYLFKNCIVRFNVRFLRARSFCTILSVLTGSYVHLILVIACEYQLLLIQVILFYFYDVLSLYWDPKQPSEKIFNLFFVLC